MKKFSMLMLILVAAFAVGSVSAQVLNGQFENGTDPGSFTTLNAVNNTNIDNWIVDGGNVDYIGNYWLGNGGKSIDLNGFTTGSIHQNLTTVAGITYQVTFDMSGNPDNPNGSIYPEGHPYFSPADKAMSVTANGVWPQTYHYITGSNSHADMQWVSNTFYFTATGSSTSLAFASQIPGAFGPALDNVKVTAITAQICHRDKGKPGTKTIIVGIDAIPAHFAHGDNVTGPCGSTPA
ncbi:MAG TPA: choice-of-anchor C family protein [Pyrinomonadaceae bacterium]|nr:choice-of-anchor C family protein [Pyrinomonadaceae bacterium]